MCLTAHSRVFKKTFQKKYLESSYQDSKKRGHNFGLVNVVRSVMGPLDTGGPKIQAEEMQLKAIT
jgi:hypothetical protein